MEDPQRHKKNWTIEIKQVLKYLRWCKIFNYPHFCQATRSQKSFSCYGMGKEIIWDLKLDFPTNGSINHLEEKWGKGLRGKEVTTKLCKIVAYFNQQGIDKIMMWLPIIILDSLTTEVLLLYGNFFKRNIKFNFWKQLGMKGWNRVTIVVTVPVQVIQ